MPPDDYIVTETNPGGYVSTTPDNLPVSVGSGEAVTDVDYGDKLPAANTYTISGTVCENTVNNDGVCDPGETPLAGVTVKLYSSAGAPIATTTTDAFGNYTFVDVPNGSYNVVETDPLFHVSVNDADGGTDNTVAVTVAGANVVDRDFVDTAQTGGLAGKVFEDLNLNGQHDAGEPGIPGVTVTLTKPDNSTVTATTDVNGDYAFPTLAPGTYTITETDLAGYISTGDVDGPNDNKIVVTVPAGVTVTGRDFGDVELGSISGMVWNDANLNGVQDIGEGPLANVTVCAAPGVGAPICAYHGCRRQLQHPERAARRLHGDGDGSGGLCQHDAEQRPDDRAQRGHGDRGLRGCAAQPGVGQHQRHGVRERERRRRLRS